VSKPVTLDLELFSTKLLVAGDAERAGHRGGTAVRRKSTTLTPQELEIMKVVWAREQATVRDVYEALLRQRQVAYTTVMTMMNVLERKGHLRKREDGRSFVYRPSRPQRQVVRSMVREFVDRVFGGDTAPLLAHLVEEEKLTREELDALAKRIEEAKG
jgi:predicted transcriptional regulator